MGVILRPNQGEDIFVNWFTWRPTVAMLVRTGVLRESKRSELCLASGSGGYLSEDEAMQAAEVLAELLEVMEPGSRILLDGTEVDTPKDYALPISEWDDEELQNHYSADYAWLGEFMEFCSCSGGFEVI